MDDRILDSLSPGTRLGELLKAYPALEEVMIRLSPEFRRLKNPVLRATVAKVATLGQVAAVGGLAVEDLIAALRVAVAQGVVPGVGPITAPPGVTPDAGAAPGPGRTPVTPEVRTGPGAAADSASGCPDAGGAMAASVLAGPAPSWFDPARVARTVDARPAIAEGRHPLPDVVRAADQLGPGEILELITPFEPAPLVDVLRGKGFRAWGERKGGDDVRTYFGKG